jgi:hypothetical protein
MRHRLALMRNAQVAARHRGVRTRCAMGLSSFLVLLVAIVVLPATAAATSSWVVKSSSGKTLGSVAVSSAGKVGFYRAGVRVGGMRFYGGDATAIAWYAPPSAGHRVKSILVTPRTYPDPDPSCYLMRAKGGDYALKGRSIRRSGRWIVQRRAGGSWHDRGWVDKSCPGWIAGGGVFVLDKLWR